MDQLQAGLSSPSVTKRKTQGRAPHAAVRRASGAKGGVTAYTAGGLSRSISVEGDPRLVSVKTRSPWPLWRH